MLTNKTVILSICFVSGNKELAVVVDNIAVND